MTQQDLDNAISQLAAMNPGFVQQHVLTNTELLAQSAQQAQSQSMFNKAMQQGPPVGLGNAALHYPNAALHYPNAALQNYPNVGAAQGAMHSGAYGAVSQPPLDERSERADAAQQEAIAAMNPLARFKYEALFRVLEIKVRYAPLARSALNGQQWILAKFMQDKGVPVRQEWSAPSKDPGCSLKTWDAMVSELMDEVTRRGGIDVATDFDYRAESAGDETASGAGNT